MLSVLNKCVLSSFRLFLNINQHNENSFFFLLFAAMYCSEFCLHEHEELIHFVECNKKPLPSVLVVCTEMLLTAVSIAGSLQKLRSLLSRDLNKTVFDFDLSNPNDSSYKKNLLIVANSMAKSEHSKIVITENMKAIFNSHRLTVFGKLKTIASFLSNASTIS